MQTPNTYNISIFYKSYYIYHKPLLLCPNSTPKLLCQKLHVLNINNNINFIKKILSICVHVNRLILLTIPTIDYNIYYTPHCTDY